MTFNKVYYYKVFLLFFIILLYFLGFHFRENAAGGAEGDFLNHTWPALQGIKNDFYYSIKNYGIFYEGAWPMFHIINAFLNPFTQSQLSFQFSITIISTLNFFLFANLLKERFSLDQINSYLLASILLILPCFRSSAFWGITENFGWLFLLLAIKFYLNLNNLLPLKKVNFRTLYLIIFTCLFSSLALYTRQYMIFFSIIYFIRYINN